MTTTLNRPTEKTPKYLDGEPVNLSAAALDALDWLKFFEPLVGTVMRLNKEAAARRALRGAILSLEKFLPEAGPIFEETQRRDFPEARVVIVASSRDPEEGLGLA